MLRYVTGRHLGSQLRHPAAKIPVKRPGNGINLVKDE
jgi:hypothetical protein